MHGSNRVGAGGRKGLQVKAIRDDGTFASLGHKVLHVTDIGMQIRAVKIIQEKNNPPGSMVKKIKP